MSKKALGVTFHLTKTLLERLRAATSKSVLTKHCAPHGIRLSDIYNKANLRIEYKYSSKTRTIFNQV